MAINPESQYPGKIAPATGDYPFGSARNITTPGDGTGTPWEAALVNDLFGFQQALLSAASLVPSGSPDKVGASQYLEALQRLGVFLYSATRSYKVGEFVRTQSGIYRSLVNSNLGNDPDADDGSNWDDFLSVASIERRVTTVAATSESLAGLDPTKSRLFRSSGWRNGGLTGGALFGSDAARTKDDHDGIDVISPTVPAVADQPGATLADREQNFRNGLGETDPGGTGVFVRVSPRLFTEADGGFSAASSILAPDTVSDDGVFYKRAATQDGLLTSSKTLTDEAEHIFDGAGRAFSVADNRGIRLSLHGSEDIPRLAGQIAQNVETFVTDGDRIYALMKGSYSLNDSSMLASYQVSRNGLSILGTPVDLGVGANCRAMTAANDKLYIFKDSILEVYSTADYGPPTLVDTVARPAAGFVQTCSIINGLLVAPVWGSDRIETYSINNLGVPILHENYTVSAGGSNASVVDGGDGSFLLIRHVSETDALGRFHFDAENKITDMQFYTITGMLQCRYGVVRNSSLYTGSFSTGELLEIPLSPEAIGGFAPSRTFDNMSSFILYDNYIIGADTDSEANSAINLDTGVTYPLESGLVWLYPQTFGDTFITFVGGDEPKPGGATANDSPMGQKLAVYKLRNNAALLFPKFPEVQPLKSVSTVYSTESSYEEFGLASGYNALGSIRQLESFSYAWAELKFSGFVVENQASSSSSYKVFEGRALLLYSGGSWTVKEAYADDVARGASTAIVALSTGIGVGFGINSPAALSGAIVRMKVELRSQNSKALSL